MPAISSGFGLVTQSNGIVDEQLAVETLVLGDPLLLAGQVETDPRLDAQGSEVEQSSAASTPTLSPAALPEEYILGGGVLLALAIAFLAHRIAQTPKPALRWAMILGCVGASVMLVMRFDQWSTNQRSAKQPPDLPHYATGEYWAPPTGYGASAGKQSSNLEVDGPRFPATGDYLPNNGSFTKVDELEIEQQHLEKRIEELESDKIAVREFAQETDDLRRALEDRDNRVNAQRQPSRELRAKPHQVPAAPPSDPPNAFSDRSYRLEGTCSIPPLACACQQPSALQSNATVLYPIGQAGLAPAPWPLPLTVARQPIVYYSSPVTATPYAGCTAVPYVQASGLQVLPIAPQWVR